MRPVHRLCSLELLFYYIIYDTTITQFRDLQFIVITQMLGGDMAIAASVVVLTGIFGATVGRGILDFLNIHDPVSRGLGMGAAGQGLGVAAMMPEQEAFPFAAINMVLTAVCATALASIPAVKECLVNIVSGGLKD